MICTYCYLLCSSTFDIHVDERLKYEFLGFNPQQFSCYETTLKSQVNMLPHDKNGTFCSADAYLRVYWVQTYWHDRMKCEMVN